MTLLDLIDYATQPLRTNIQPLTLEVIRNMDMEVEEPKTPEVNQEHKRKQTSVSQVNSMKKAKKQFSTYN